VIFLVSLVIVLIIAFCSLLLQVIGGANTPAQAAGQEAASASQRPGATQAASTSQTAAAPQAAATSQAPAPPQTMPTSQIPATPAPEPPPAPLPRETEPAERPPVALPQEQPPPASTIGRPTDSRDRNLYFMQAQRSGAELLLTRTSRRIGGSDSPLVDSINALLAGPTAEEKNRGLLSFIPPETRLIWAEVRGSTAYLNFNEDFQYNTSGREGSAAQIRQIVWTATEFSNINDVQILIDGKRIDFLIEGVMIGSPIGR
jgi:hypothetical protein